MKSIFRRFPRLRISLELAVTGLEGASGFFPTCSSCSEDSGWGGTRWGPACSPPRAALFLPLNALTLAASVTTSTSAPGVVLAVSQRVSGAAKCLGRVRLSHCCAPSSAGPPRNGLVSPWKQQHSLTASGRPRVNSGLT